MILKELFRDYLEVVTATEHDRIRDAAEKMRNASVGSVVVVADKKVVGIMTDRDIALALALGAATPDSFVAEVMTRNVHTVEESLTLLDVTRRFRSTRVKRLPVVDDNRNLVGIVSTDDVMAMLSMEMHDTCSSLQPKLGHLV